MATWTAVFWGTLLKFKHVYLNTVSINAAGAVKKLKSKTPDFSLTESEVNAWGYKLVSQKRLQDALELFRLNVYLYPESANAFDSLGEIYTEPGNKKPPVDHYRNPWSLILRIKMPDSRSKIWNRPILRLQDKTSIRKLE